METYNFIISYEVYDLGIEAEDLEDAIRLIKLKYEDLHDITLNDKDIKEWL